MSERPNNKYLLKPEDLTPQQRRDNASKAGKASAAAKKRKKSLKELAQTMLSCRASDANIKAMKNLFPDLTIGDVTIGATLLAKQIDKASKGDTKSFEVLRDTSGQKPTNSSELSVGFGPTIISDNIPNGG